MTLFRRILSTLIFVLFALHTFAVSTPTGKVCILDITKRISEIEASSRNVYSAAYMIELAGLPYFTTTSLSDAMQQSTMILLSSEVKKSAFTADELNALSHWVEKGGTLVSPAASVVNYSSTDATAAKALFGVVSSTKNKARYQLIWSADHYDDKELEYIDEPEERTEINGTPSADETRWDGTAEIYNIAGLQQPTLSRGFFIVRDRNGNTRKILKR